MSWVLIFYKNFNIVITLYVYRKQKIMVDSSDWNFSASEHSNIGLMSELCYVFYLNVKNPAFAKQKNSSNAKGYL